MKAHALLSASSAARWLECPPSARLEENFPDTTSEYAKEGTLAHEVAELKLRKFAIEPMTQRTYSAKLNKLKKNELWQAEMDEHTDTYLDYIKGVMLSYKTKPYVMCEKRVDFSRYVPEGFGTADCLIMAGDTLHVIDLKYGKGVQVDAENNPQMLLYALGALEACKMLFAPKVVKLTIVQPRLNNISEWEVPVDVLLKWADVVVAEVAKLAYEGKGDFKPGSHCKFCRAKAQCKARAEACMELVPIAEAWQGAGGERATMKSVAGLYSKEELSEYLAKGKILKDWYEDISGHALALCLNGEDVPGFKAVEGRGSRAFTDLDEAFDVLMKAGIDEAMLYERKPLTLAQAEKVVGRSKFAELVGNYIVSNPGKPTLVPESDKRKAISNAVKAEDVFERLEM